MAQSKAKPASPSGNARDRLLEESARLFMEHGYERTTMRTIAEATGIKLGSIAYYFKNKEDILFEAMKTIVESGERRALSAVAGHSSATSQLRALIAVELDVFVNETGAIVIKEWRCLAEQRQEELLEHRRHYEDLWLDVLGDCHAEGVVRCDPIVARRFLQGAFAWSESWYSAAGDLDIDEVADEVARLITQSKPKNTTN